MKFSTALSCLATVSLFGSATAQTIVDIAVSDGNFSTLVAAVTQAGLADTLSGDGPYTVFAPTNQAFNESVPADTLSMLLEDMWKPHLTAILLYHVLEGAVLSTDLTDGMMAQTLEGDSLNITLNPVQVNGVDVVTADIEASNGVIHVIDQVLLPPFMSMDIVATAQANDDFSTLVSLVVAADLVEALQGSGLTVFAPTNSAFEALGNETLANLTMAENKQMLVDILSYHVVPGIVTSDQLTNDESVDTLLEGKSLRVTLDPVQVNGVDVVMADILTSNGVIHVVDQVLLVPSDSGSDGGNGGSDGGSGGSGGSGGGDGSGSRGVSLTIGAAILAAATFTL